jgi:hypothetical protein
MNFQPWLDDREFRESIDELYQRHRFPPRLGRIAVFDQAIASGRHRIRLRSAQPRQGLRPQLCPFESRVIGIGPQIGFIFPVAGMQGYLNLKAYKEFDNANRPDGWNAWVTLVLSPAPAAESSPPPILTKSLPRS